MLTVAFEDVEDGWVQARIVEVPGVISAGRTRDEARELVVDALREYLLAAGDEASQELRDASQRKSITLQVAP